MLDNVRKLINRSDRQLLPDGSRRALDRVSTRKKEWGLTQESFDHLLAWLHPDREQAGRIYEEIHARLIMSFKAHDCPVPEDLADETINRVAKKLPELADTYVGDRARYFFGVAYKVLLEYRRSSPEFTELPPDNLLLGDQPDNIEAVYNCLEKCLESLPEHNRELILQFYQGEKHVKIEWRKELARRLGTKLTNLRLQAHRIRATLKQCIRSCMEQAPIG
jgi:DNA-directed RNA polymerase specialized sigma24 family protein